LEISRQADRWNFAEVTPSGTRILIAESNTFAQAGSKIPAGDTYKTPRDTKHEVTFSCCGVSGSAATQDKSDDTGAPTTVLILVGITVFAVGIILAVLAYLNWWAKKSRAFVPPLPTTHVDDEFAHQPGTEKFVEPTPKSMVMNRMAHSDSTWMTKRQDAITKQDEGSWERSPSQIEEGYMHDRMDNSPQTWTPTQDDRAYPSHNTSEQADHALFTNRIDCLRHKRNSRRAVTPVSGWANSDYDCYATGPNLFSPPPVRSKYGDSLKSQGMLREAGNSQGNHREDAASILTDEFSEVHGEHDRGTSRFGVVEEGLEVRIVGLENEPTWDGAKGIVDGYDEFAGIVRIKFPDGRIKSVSERNCEPASRTPTRSKNLRDSTQTGELAASVQRHRGIMAKPQGSVTAARRAAKPQGDAIVMPRP
jgi:hypothetical protein